MQMHEKSQIINLQTVKEIKQSAKEYQQSVISLEQLQKHDSLVALYIYAQNHLSVLMEIFAEMPVLKNLIRRIMLAQDKYMPSYPPMSPVTESHFFCWSAFDLMVGGVKKESFCTIICDYCNSTNFDAMLIEIFENFQQSYCGIYIHEGIHDDCVILRELITNKRFTVKVASGYAGKTGELWYARVLPPLFGLNNYSVIFGTPYIISEVVGRNIQAEWLDYFERQLSISQNINKEKSYQDFMKFGINKDFWMEYITLAYLGFSSESIDVDGIPDIAESLPLGHLADW
ncbi:MAG TPA: hypothetical protein ENJ44_06215 [Oceanospirillales bacterium]|nr:hypothetical protein [Oceanospirillales bacterium]